MGGEGPYVKFLQEDFRLVRGTWTDPPSSLDDKELDEAYTGAHAFLLERVRQLVQHGWEQHETDGTITHSTARESLTIETVHMHRFLVGVLELYTCFHDIRG